MVYGSSADVAVATQYVPAKEFRRVLENAPAGVFTREAWQKWHEQFGMPVPPMPGASFPMARSVPSPVVSLAGDLVANKLRSGPVDG
jgi:hypothetical protein